MAKKIARYRASNSPNTAATTPAAAPPASTIATASESPGAFGKIPAA